MITKIKFENYFAFIFQSISVGMKFPCSMVGIQDGYSNAEFQPSKSQPVYQLDWYFVANKFLNAVPWDFIKAMLIGLTLKKGSFIATTMSHYVKENCFNSHFFNFYISTAYKLIINWHERSVFQSVGIWHYFLLFFSALLSTFLIEGVLGSNNLFSSSWQERPKT